MSTCSRGNFGVLCSLSFQVSACSLAGNHQNSLTVFGGYAGEIEAAVPGARTHHTLAAQAKAPAMPYAQYLSVKGGEGGREVGR
jgi:hypothetical protein